MNDALASDKPDLGRLTLLFNQCSPYSHGWSRLADNDATRYCRWTGQSPDGRKHAKLLPQGERVFPFEGASDCRIPTADEIIRFLNDICLEAYARAILNIAGNPEAEQSGAAARARKMIQWVRGTKLHGKLLREFNLLNSHGLTYGVAVMQIGWERTLGVRMYEFTMDKLMVMAQQAEPGTPMSLFPQMISDPALEDEAIEVLRQLHQAYALAAKPSNAEYEVKELSTKRARAGVRALRTDGQCELPLPYLCTNEPRVRARKLWEDCFIPESADDLQSAPAIFVVDYYTEAQLRAKAEAEEWNEDWVEQAVKLKGQQSEWAPGRRQNVDLMDGSSVSWVPNEQSEQIEVITAYRKCVDADGVLCVQETIYHGNLKSAPNSREDLVAKHGDLEYPIGTNYPLVGWAWEETQRAFTLSRGVPQVVATWQRNLKALEDSCIDRTSLETMPPIKVPQVMGVSYVFAPGGQVPLRPGAMAPEAMNIVGPGGKTAEFLMDRIEQRVANYFGLPRPDEPPQNALVKQQKLVRSYLEACSQTLWMAFALCLDHLPPEEIEQITGSAEPLQADELQNVYQLTFNVQEMSPDWVEMRLKAVSEIAATDASGVTDQGAVTRWKYRAIDPSLEQQLTIPTEGVSGAIYKKVKEDFVDMFMGVPPDLTENDPTAQQQLQFGQKILETSQEYQKKMQEDERFREWVELWSKSKQHSIDQQVNKQTGRVGVDARQFQPQAAA